MKTYKTLIIGLSFLFIVISAVMIFYNFAIIKEVRTIPMFFEVGDKMGVNTDADALYFGKAYPGSMTTRNVKVVNNYDFPLFFSIKVKGNISEFTSVSDNDFVLEPNEEKKIIYYVRTSPDDLKGHYNGLTTIVMNRAFFT